MKVVVDDKIPFIREAIGQIADEVLFVPGAAFTPRLVRDADALIVRTRTRCDEQLLAGSKVRFIATATIGFDHIDTHYCQRAGIIWTNAPGCNAASVEQYVRSSLYLWQQVCGRQLQGLTLGVVGVGHVGSRVARMGAELGMTVLLNDPPREAQEGGAAFRPLSELAACCDILTFHVPLCREGAYRTWHLADEVFFHTLRRKPLLINTSRGEVVETEALRRALNEERLSDAIIDVWEREPDIDRTLLQQVLIGTPHIAGYSADGKANATRMSLDALCRFFHVDAHYTIVPPPPASTLIRVASAADAALQMYDPRRDSEALKAHPEQFEQLRGNYPLRREAEAFQIEPLADR